MTTMTERVADAAAVATLGLGIGLTAAPDRTTAVLGLGPDRGPARAIGAADVALGVMMLRRRRRARWMGVRAAFNLVIAGCYGRELHRSGSPRAKLGIAAMTGFTILDGAVALRLRDTSDSGGNDG